MKADGSWALTMANLLSNTKVGTPEIRQSDAAAKISGSLMSNPSPNYWRNMISDRASCRPWAVAKVISRWESMVLGTRPG